jgi:hypothetical protein
MLPPSALPTPLPPCAVLTGLLPGCKDQPLREVAAVQRQLVHLLFVGGTERQGASLRLRVEGIVEAKPEEIQARECGRLEYSPG